MNVAVTIPDKFIENRHSISREMLESYAIENFRLEKLSFGQLSELLSLTVDETYALLKKRRVPHWLDQQDPEESRRTVEKFLNKC